MSPTPPTDESGHTGHAQRNFTIVPNGVIAAKIGGTSLRVYLALRSYLRPGHATYPHVSTVCETYNIPERSFAAALVELQEAGLLRVEKRTYAQGFRRANEYFFPDVDDAKLPVGTAKIAGPELLEIAGPEPQLFALPKEEEKSEEEKSQTATRKRVATRMSSDYPLTPAMVTYAHGHLPGYDIVRLFEEFKNYWIGEGKAKADWEATWRNRVLQVADRDAAKIRDIKSKQSAAQAAPELDPYGDPRWA
jgi:hypothetical protein